MDDDELIIYGGAPHAFTVFESDRYREIPDKRSRARFLDFLSEVFFEETSGFEEES
ncbi:MAG: hypothetical protein JJU29_06640 [Verrucomicrobia bacterium]|nr:hypothetical protein [Verrucomicrobiota bacterium]MCH8511551.1 hypothetical protein [Kiritimatiellia bacterium]